MTHYLDRAALDRSTYYGYNVFASPPLCAILTGPPEALGSNLVSTVDIARIIHEIDTSPLNRGLRGIDWVSDPRNIAVMEGDDLALFDYEAPGIYQGHFLFQSRGKEAVEATRILTRRMFEHGARMLVGYVPVCNRKAGVIARMAGWHYAGIKATEDGPMFVYLIAPETH